VGRARAERDFPWASDRRHPHPRREPLFYLLKELLGQSDISTTEIYSHAKQEALAAAVNALEFDDTEQPGECMP